MTISSTTRKAGPYLCDGVQVAFPFAYKVFRASDLYVVRTNAAGLESVLTLTTDYTVALNSNQNVSPGGTVTFNTPPASGFKVTLGSAVPNTQPTDLTNQGGFYPSVIADALDRAGIQIQQLAEKVGRSVTTDFSSSQTPEDLINQINTNAAAAAASANASANSAAAAAQSAADADSASRRGPIGQPFFWDAIVPPYGALILDTSAIPRATYLELFEKYSNPTACTFTAGSNQVTGVPAMTVALLGGGGVKSPQIPVEGVGIPDGCKIASISGTTITLTANATANGSLILIFIHGNGDGSTTFNLASGTDFWRGKDPSNVKDAGRVLGSLQVDTFREHDHASPTGGTAVMGTVEVPVGTASGYDYIAAAPTSKTGGTETRPANTSKLPCVWAF